MRSKKDITKNPAAFRKRIAEYFEKCDAADKSPACLTCKNSSSESCENCRKKQVPYTLSGLCLSLGITKRQFNSLKTNKCLSDDIEMALLKIESYIEENSVGGNVNATLAVAVLKENFGWGEDDVPSSVKIELSREASEYGV